MYELVYWYFGVGLECTISVLFIFMRTFLDGFRLFGASIVFSFLFSLFGGLIDMMLVVSICVLVVVIVFYIWVGGMMVVVWMDVAQLGLYFVGVLFVIVFLGIEIPGGVTGVWKLVGDVGKFSLMDFSFDVSWDYIFWFVVIGGVVFIVGTYGVDQMFVQCYLVCVSISYVR